MTREQKINEWYRELLDIYVECEKKKSDALAKYRDFARTATDDPEPPEIPERIKWLREGWEGCRVWITSLGELPTRVRSMKVCEETFPWPEVKAKEAAK